MELEERSVPRIRVRQQHRVWKILAQPVRVAHRNHFIVLTVNHEDRLLDAAQIRESLPVWLLPITVRCHLRLRDFRAGWLVAIILAPREPFDELAAGGLTRIRLIEEYFLKHLIAVQRRVVEPLREVRLVEMHDVLAAARCRPDENHLPEDGWSTR